MQALVTGGNGFIGSFLVERLLLEGWQVRCLVRKTSDLRWLKALDVEFFLGELNDPRSLQRAVENCDVVFHLGGVTKGRVEQDYINGNCKATYNVIEAMRTNGAPGQKLVYISSQAAGGPSIEGRALTEDEALQPISAYGRSKRMAEEAVLEFSRTNPATIIRPPSVYGPRDKDFYLLFKNVNRGVIPRPGDGRQKISVVYIRDLVEGIYLSAIRESANGEIFFISQDDAVSFAQLGRLVAQALQKKAFTIPVPLWLVQGMTIFSVSMSKITGKAALLNPDKVLEMKQPAWVCSNSKAKRMLGFMPKTDLGEGLKRTAAWYKSVGWL